MKKIIMTIFLFSVFVSSAQNTNLKERLNIKIGYSNYPWMGDFDYGATANNFKTFTPVGIVDSNYRPLKYLETGAYFGFSMYESLNVYKISDDNSVILKPSLNPMLLYGVSINLQLLPIFLKNEFSIIDIYLSSKLGGIYFVDENKSEYAKKRSKWDYGIYGGVEVFPFKHWGFFYEYGYGNYIRWKVGLSLKLNKQ